MEDSINPFGLHRDRETAEIRDRSRRSEIRDRRYYTTYFAIQPKQMSNLFSEAWLNLIAWTGIINLRAMLRMILNRIVQVLSFLLLHLFFFFSPPYI